jgi:hypothetical protein
VVLDGPEHRRGHVGATVVGTVGWMATSRRCAGSVSSLACALLDRRWDGTPTILCETT